MNGQRSASELLITDPIRRQEDSDRPSTQELRVALSELHVAKQNCLLTCRAC